MPGVTERDRDKQGDADPRRIYQSRSCPHADFDSAEPVSIAGSPVLEGKKLAQIALGV